MMNTLATNFQHLERPPLTPTHDGSTFTAQRRRSRCFKAIAGGGLVLVLAAATGAVGADSASAAAARYRIVNTGGQGVSARTGPTTAPGAGYGAPEGAVIDVNCQVIGQPVGRNGNTLHFWSTYSGRNFYVPDTYTDSPHLAGQPPIQGIPMCGGPAPAPPPPSATSNASKAVAWARGQIGQRQADTATANAYSDWYPGPKGEWSGDCAKLVHRAWALQGVQTRRGPDALAIYRQYRDAGQIRVGGTPPAGALVFWNVTSWGHVALATGNNTVITTRGSDGNWLPIQEVSTGYFGSPLGWVLPG